MTNLTENEHVLTTPELVGIDSEKVAGIRYWADIIGYLRSINTTFVSYENKKAVIAALEKELELISLEIDNTTSKVSQGEDGIPSADQTPQEEPADVNVVDLTKSDEVAATTSPARKAPTFESLDKLRRVAGTGIWAKNYGPVTKVKK